MELGVNKFYRMSFDCIGSTTIQLAISCKSNND